MSKGKRELFEILSRPGMGRSAIKTGGTLPGEEESGIYRPESVYVPEARRSEKTSDKNISPDTEEAEDASEMQRTVGPTQLVIGVDTGLAIFLVVAVMLATAFWLGYDHGRKNLAERMQLAVARDRDTLPTRESSVPNEDMGEYRKAPPHLPANAYVIRLISFDRDERGLELARDVKRHAAEQGVIDEVRMNVFIIANEAAYSVAVGPTESPNDPALDRVQRVFRNLSGPPTTTGRGDKPYAGLIVEKAQKLGQVLSE